ncbi:haloacid dehalogenase type II [Azospira restricta]|uniref:(S)-2-haloacid dehalogenase n=1 Tax=Azospira restricta TaxID=404405 RepID=A0A974Y3Z6_9RHOO|nr:haloacid dehalogenase type II [Azospira restricta]QRJ64174.1 haloacid dehalogenase type II [Azospira restricta]
MDRHKLLGIEVVVFDAYGTLFDVGSVARGAEEALGERWLALSELWRSKQLQYTWLRGLAGHHADFWQVTADALDFALAALGIDDPPLRERLLHRYLRIAAYPEVPATLAALKARGLQLAILSNGSPAMLAAAVANAGIGDLLDAVLSVEAVGVYKPHPAVYGLAVDRFGIVPGCICFLSANGWDAFSAKSFGFRVLWCNRARQPPERIPSPPDGEIGDLSALPDWLA